MFLFLNDLINFQQIRNEVENMNHLCRKWLQGITFDSTFPSSAYCCLIHLKNLMEYLFWFLHHIARIGCQKGTKHNSAVLAVILHKRSPEML